MFFFFRNKKANAILLGDHGVGKTVIVQKLVDNVIKKRCHKEIKKAKNISQK